MEPGQCFGTVNAWNVSEPWRQRKRGVRGWSSMKRLLINADMKTVCAQHFSRRQAMSEISDDGTLLAVLSPSEAYRRGMADMRERAARLLKGMATDKGDDYAKCVRVLPIDEGGE